MVPEGGGGGAALSVAAAGGLPPFSSSSNGVRRRTRVAWRLAIWEYTGMLMGWYHCAHAAQGINTLQEKVLLLRERATAAKVDSPS